MGYTLLQGLLALLSPGSPEMWALYSGCSWPWWANCWLFTRSHVEGILATAYLLVLAFTNFARPGINRPAGSCRGTIPTIIFVGIYVILYTRQAEANARAAELLAELETANRQLTEYAARVEDVTIATERQRMARELHDTLSQGLAGLILQLEAADAHLAALPGAAARVSWSFRWKRRAARCGGAPGHRRPAPAGRAKPGRSCTTGARRFTQATGIACAPEIDLQAAIPERCPRRPSVPSRRALPTSPGMPGESGLACCLSENAANELEIEVCDDGSGSTRSRPGAGHYGLLGMRERVRLAGGRLDIHSEPGKGTCLLIIFPLENANPAPGPFAPAPSPLAAGGKLKAWNNTYGAASIRILVADDHLIIRQGLRLILETQDGFELVGEAADGAEALRLCAELHPDVVLMDLRMPGMDGLTAIERLRVEQPGIAVVILTTFNEDDLMMRGLRLGAKGYLLKDTDRETLFNTIRAASRGETLLRPEIMARCWRRAVAFAQPPQLPPI